MKCALVLLSFFCSIVAVAQQPAVEPPAFKAAAEQASREDVLHFFKAAQVREQAKTALDNMSVLMKQQVSTNISGLLKVRFPNVTEEEIHRFDPVFDKLMARMNVDDMVESMVPIYQKHFSHPDIQAATAFYETDAGQRVAAATRLATAEATQAGAEYGRKIAEDAMPQLKKDIEAIVADIAKAHRR